MRCKNCGWDNPNDNVKCEKCNAPLGGNAGNEEPTVLGKTIRETERDTVTPPKKTVPEKEINEPNVGNGTPFTGGTIPPWATSGNAVSTVGYCKLSPLPNIPNEKHMPKEVSLKGSNIALKRENLDPDNNTISQNNQAELTYKNGKWYIKDESAYKTTYIHADKETPLKDGDIILMGNRRFVFTEE